VSEAIMLHDMPHLRKGRYVDAARCLRERYADELYGRVAAGERPVVAIGGESGSGKTSIACIFCQLLNEDPRQQPALLAKHLCADNLYLSNYLGRPPGLREATRRGQGFRGIGPEEYNWDADIPPYASITALIRTFRAADGPRAVAVPLVDVLSQQVDLHRIDFDQEVALPVAAAGFKRGPVNVLVIEGIYAVDARLGADVSVLLARRYYDEQPWGALRPAAFDAPEGEPRDHDAAVSEIRTFATRVMAHADREHKGADRKELSAERVIVLELEHRAVAQLRRAAERAASAGERRGFALLAPEDPPRLDERGTPVHAGADAARAMRAQKGATHAVAPAE
jgi:hypothetical protein